MFDNFKQSFLRIYQNTVTPQKDIIQTQLNESCLMGSLFNDQQKRQFKICQILMQKSVMIKYKCLNYIYLLLMIDEFYKVLKTPKISITHTLGKTQDMILRTFEEIFPQTFEVQYLHKIYEQVLGIEVFPGEGSIQVTVDQQILLNYRLTEYFINQLKENFINIDIYKALQEQTQRAQSINRAHIRVQQQMKMYMEYLQAKLQKLTKQHQLTSRSQSPDVKRQINILHAKEVTFQKQKINLIKKNQKLKTQIQILQTQIKSLRVSRQPSQTNLSTNRRKLYSQLLPQKKNEFKQHIDYQQKNERTNNTSKLTINSRQRQIYRVNGHDNELTLKKKGHYFPGRI